MITRFYYSLTVPVNRLHTINENEFGMVLQKEVPLPEPLPPQIVFDRYAPINQEQGIFWLVSELTDETVGEDTDITKELLKHVWLNLYDKNIGYVDVEHPTWEHPNKPYVGADYIEMKHEVGNAIWSLYLDTEKYYTTLINIYENELDDLLADVASQSEVVVEGSANGDTRFNDTPQNTPIDDGYAADNYTTNITKSTSSNSSTTTTTQSTNLTTKMNRINEVQNMLKNLYADWAFEFNKLIVGE